MIKIVNIKQGLFFGLLNLDEFSIAEKLTQKREIETAGKYYLLKHLLGEQAQINYTNNGKPYLVNDLRHISISHSYNKLVIIINEHEPTGIDIEIIRDKILNIKHKFLSNSELNDAGNDIEKLLIYWSAKETLYKLYGEPIVDFATHFSINPFSKQNFGTVIACIGSLTKKQTLKLNYQILENYVLVYALQQHNQC